MMRIIAIVATISVAVLVAINLLAAPRILFVKFAEKDSSPLPQEDFVTFQCACQAHGKFKLF